MFSNIKNFFLKRYISANRPPKSTRLVNLNSAKSVALICEITDEDSYKSIFQLFTKLQNGGRQVKLIGYINDKEVPFYCLSQLSADYFCNKQLTWYGLPNAVQLQDFLKEEYDVLLDFNTATHTPVQALLALTRSRFVVGRNPESQPYYDLFIDDRNGNDLHFLESVQKYTLKLTGNDR